MVKHLPTIQETGFNPWVGKIPWRREGLPTPVCLPGEFHAQRSLAGYIQSMGSQRVGQDRATNTSELLEKESRGSWPPDLWPPSLPGTGKPEQVGPEHLSSVRLRWGPFPQLHHVHGIPGRVRFLGGSLSGASFEGEGGLRS